MEDLIRILAPFALAAIVGLVGWVWRLWNELRDLERSFSSYKQHISDSYAKAATLDKFEEKLDRLSHIVTRIAEALHIKTNGHD